MKKLKKQIEKIKLKAVKVIKKGFDLTIVPLVKIIIWPFAKTLGPIFKFLLKPFNKWYDQKLNYRQKRAVTGWLFTIPYWLGAMVFVVVPLLLVIYMSFFKVNINGETGSYTFDWVGLQNYNISLFKDLDFMLALQDFFVEIILYVPIIIALAIIIAVLLNSKVKGTSFFRLIYFIPVLILSGTFLENLETFGGLRLEINEFTIKAITTIGATGSMDMILALFATISRTLWFTAVPALIFLAALQKVDKSLYEAAAIDGASPWDTFWKITLPSIWPLVNVTVVFTVVFYGNFDGNPINQIIVDTMTNFSKGGYGTSSAQSISYTIVQIVLILILLFVTQPKKSKKRGV